MADLAGWLRGKRHSFWPWRQAFQRAVQGLSVSICSVRPWGLYPRSQSATPPGTTLNSGWTRDGDAACPSSHPGARASSFFFR